MENTVPLAVVLAVAVAGTPGTARVAAGTIYAGCLKRRCRMRLWFRLLRCWRRPYPLMQDIVEFGCVVKAAPANRYNLPGSWVRGLPPHVSTGVVTGVRSWRRGAGYTLRDRLQVIHCWITAGHRLATPPMEEGMARCYSRCSVGTLAPKQLLV